MKPNSTSHNRSTVPHLNMVHPRPKNRADDAWFGDPVPFYWNGTFHLFYVWDQGHLIMPRVSHRWGHFASKDLVNWEEYPFAVQPEPEASDGTGSIFEANGQFHMYFLGRYFRTNGEMYETICHAFSQDLIHWEKNPDNPISLPDSRYYRDRDWRDGFPFWVTDKEEFWMLVTATLHHGPESRRGCLALLTSKDLVTWQSVGPYWTPSLGSELECPDLFQWNDWWYLLVSGTFGQTTGTIYRKSRSPEGPWETPTVDTFDGPLLYACKTAGDETRRILFGWVGTRRGDVDAGPIQWGGHGIMRELVQDENGDLWVTCPSERITLGTPEAVPAFTPHMGKWTQPCASSWLVMPSSDLSYATAAVPPEFLFRTRIRPTKDTRRFGVFVRTNETLSEGYQIEVDTVMKVLSITSFGAPGERHAMPILRQLPCAEGDEHTLTVFASGTIIEVFLDNHTALVGRYYNRNHQRLGLFTECGGAVFSDIELRRLPDDPW